MGGAYDNEGDRMIPGITNSMLGSGGSGDVEPDAVAWGDISAFENFSAEAFNSAVTISGITQPIYLMVSFSGFTKSPGAVASFRAFNGSGLLLGEAAYMGASSTIEIGPISPGDSIYFGGYLEYSPSGQEWTSDVVVKYKSNGSSSYDQTLDTFYVGIFTLGL